MDMDLGDKVGFSHPNKIEILETLVDPFFFCQMIIRSMINVEFEFMM